MKVDSLGYKTIQVISCLDLCSRVRNTCAFQNIIIWPSSSSEWLETKDHWGQRIHYTSKIRLFKWISKIDIITIKPMPKNGVLFIILKSPDIPKDSLLTLKIFLCFYPQVYKSRSLRTRHNGWDRCRFALVPARFFTVKGESTSGKEMPEILGFQESKRISQREGVSSLQILIESYLFRSTSYRSITISSIKLTIRYIDWWSSNNILRRSRGGLYVASPLFLRRRWGF